MYDRPGSTDAHAERFQGKAPIGIDDWMAVLRAYILLFGGLAALGLVSVG